MSEPGHFLSRWARRKQAVAEQNTRRAEGAAPPAVAPGEIAGGRSAEDNVNVAEPAPPAFDLEALPPIDSITGATDIRPFLAPGVPPELTRAALRRAFVADPSIRDFVGFAEYAWDYHTPGAMPGFGPLAMTDELRRAVARIVGAHPPESGDEHSPAARGDQAATSPTAPDLAGRQTHKRVGHGQQSDGKQPDESRACEVLSERPASSAATPGGPEKLADRQSIGRRRHGSALPR
jgi:hypothetical protein